MRRLAPVLLGAAAAVYVCAAWLVPPGFFDGFAPPAPYHWVSPPPDLRSSNQPPASGHVAISFQNGVAQAGHAFTADQQAAVTFPSQSFEAPANGSPATLEIRPVATFPALGGVVPAGNVYLVSASTRLISPVVVTLRYGSRNGDPPSQIFSAGGPAGLWKSIGSISSGVPYTVAASAQALGYFVVGYLSGSSATPAGTPSGAGGPSVLVLVAGGAVALVLVAGFPLMAARRRAAPAAEEEPAPRPVQNLGGARRRGGRRRR